VAPTKPLVGTTLATEAIKRASRKGCPNHPIDLKRRLAALACEPEVSVAKIALTHGINANLLFKWRRQYRAGKFGAVAPAVAAGMATPLPAKLLPVVATSSADVARDAGRTPSCIEIVLGPATVRVCGEVNSAVLRTVLDCLALRR
jgi:transposase